jgi:hypothetical protein
MTSADRQSAQIPHNHGQKRRSATVNLGHFLAERRSTPIWLPQRQDLHWESGPQTEVGEQ